VNVLHVMPSLGRTYGGPVTALVGYATAGETLGLHATVVGPRCGAADGAWLEAHMPHADVVLAGAEGSGPWSGAAAVLAHVRRLVGRADVVHVHGLLNPTSSGASRLAIASGRAVVIGPFGTMSRYTFRYRRRLVKQLYFRAMDAPNLRRAAALHFTTATERDDAAWLGINGDGRTYVVPPPYQRTATGRRLGDAAASGHPIVLFLGRLHPVKGIDVLLEGWKYVRARHPTAELRIAGTGDPSYLTRLRQHLAPDDGAAASVKFLGFVADDVKARHLTEAAVVALPSLHENFGIAVLDAASSGAPVVVTPGVQLAPWVDAEGMGRVVDRTVEAVAAAIADALDDTALRRHVAAAGPAAVARAFSPSAVAPALEAMYRAAHRRQAAA
jgi:glycosyltransferase involved in cell wall biosynthesis